MSNLSDIVVMLFSGFATIVVAVAAYFADKYIKSVDSRLATHTTRLNSLDDKIPRPVDYVRITKIVDDKVIERSSISHKVVSRFDNLTDDVKIIKDTMSKKLLPHITKSEEYYGKVTVLEKELSEQQQQTKTLFKAVTVIAKRTKK